MIGNVCFGLKWQNKYRHIMTDSPYINYNRKCQQVVLHNSLAVIGSGKCVPARTCFMHNAYYIVLL